MIADMLASIHTSCDIPAGSVFGPCDPQHTSLGDNIAFIALRCSDRHAMTFAHQVDTSVPSVSVEGSVWLRLVRSARNRDEQNMEAYVKDGRLFYRAKKNIFKNMELLVWYGMELFELLGLTCVQKNNKGYRCSYCKQSFQFEFPVVAHQRFFCTERPMKFSKPGSSRLLKKPSMDFHNMARNLVNCTSPLRDSGKGSLAKRRHSVDSESDESDKKNPVSAVHGHPLCKRVCAISVKRNPLSGSTEISMTNEGVRSLHWATRCQGNFDASLDILDSSSEKNPVGAHNVSHFRGSQLSSAASDQEEKSAFTQPPRSISQITNLALTFRLIPGIVPVGNATTLPSILTQAAAKATEPQASALLHRSLLKQQALVYKSELLSRDPKPLQAQISPEWCLLPAALSPLGLPAQNWCAKCNVSFHLTSDLVQHMRSHHKRSAQQLRPHSEERLRCPICDEGFRERHHLSRHMSSHTKSDLAQHQ